MGTVPLPCLGMPWDCLFCKCSCNQRFPPLLSSGSFELSGPFTERQRGNRWRVRRESSSSSTHSAVKHSRRPTRDPAGSKTFACSPQARKQRCCREMLDQDLSTPSCPVSASGGGHAWSEPMASCNQLPYHLDMRDEKRCPTPLEQGGGEYSCWRHGWYHLAWPAWARTPQSHHPQLLTASSLVPPDSWLLNHTDLLGQG